MIAARRLFVSRRTRKYAQTADDRNASRTIALCAAIGLPVAAYTGAASTPRPTVLSEYASVFLCGAKILASNRCAGSAASVRAIHAMRQTLKYASLFSNRPPVPNIATRG